jgi:quercetin dioxygenase-like cupin family protein
MAQTHAASGDPIDVRPLGTAIAGQVTTAIMKSAQLELVRLVLPSGKSMREHRVVGEITVQCIEGLIELTTPHASLRLGPGQLVHLQGGEAHSLLALADSTALLTICLPAAPVADKVG